MKKFVFKYMELDDFKNILIPFDNVDDRFSLLAKNWDKIIRTFSCYANDKQEGHNKMLSRLNSNLFLTLYEKDFISLPTTCENGKFIVLTGESDESYTAYRILGNIQEEISAKDSELVAHSSRFIIFYKNSTIIK